MVAGYCMLTPSQRGWAKDMVGLRSGQSLGSAGWRYTFCLPIRRRSYLGLWPHYGHLRPILICDKCLHKSHLMCSGMTLMCWRGWHNSVLGCSFRTDSRVVVEPPLNPHDTRLIFLSTPLSHLVLWQAVMDISLSSSPSGGSYPSCGLPLDLSLSFELQQGIAWGSPETQAGPESHWLQQVPVVG